MNDKLIIEKLFQLAMKQQKILTKLAQTADSFPEEDVEGNKKYLVGAWMTACLNSEIPGMTPEVEYIPGGTSPNNPNIVLSSTYMVTGVVPEKVRMQFKETFERQVASQKPELDGRVGMIFLDPK